MSERKRKRTRKKSGPDVRSLQTREGDNGVQAETGPMPQQESEVVAEADTGNTTENEGGNKMNGTFMDRIREHKQTILQGLVYLAIAVVVSVVVVMQFAPSKGVVTEYMATTDQSMQAASAHITTLIDEVNDIQAMDLIGSDDLIPITDQAAETAANVTALGTRLGEAEVDILNHTNQLATMHASPPECYLSGNLTTGNLTLHARASEAGNYTANVHLAYYFATASGFNGTYEEAQQYFYTGINWTTGTPYYQTVVSFNGTHWGLAETWWNIGTFALTANNETAMTVLFGGLNYTADFAYADIYQIVK